MLGERQACSIGIEAPLLLVKTPQDWGSEEPLLHNLATLKTSGCECVCKARSPAVLQSVVMMCSKHFVGIAQIIWLNSMKMANIAFTLPKKEFGCLSHSYKYMSLHNKISNQINIEICLVFCILYIQWHSNIYTNNWHKWLS